MPATSVRQRRYFAWAEHHPDQAAAEGKTPGGRGKGMSHQQMHDFAATPELGLPKVAGSRARSRRKYYSGMGG